MHVYPGDVEVQDGCFVAEEGSELLAGGPTITIDDWTNGIDDLDPRITDFNLQCDQLCGPDIQPIATCSFDVTIPAALIPMEGQIYVNVHLDYGLKGPHIDANPCDELVDRYDRHPAISQWGSSHALEDSDTDDGRIAIADCQDYLFSHTDDPLAPPIFEDSVQNLNVFKRIAGAFGRVYCSDTGSGYESYYLELVRDSSGEIVSEALTDEDGFNTLPYKHKGRPSQYTVNLYDDQDKTTLLHSQVIELQGNGWVEIQFDGCPVWSSTAEYGKGRNKGKSK